MHDGLAGGTDVDGGCMRCHNRCAKTLQGHRDVHVRVGFPDGANHPVLVPDLSYLMDPSVAFDHALLVKT
jgi:hypothetical protein